MIQFSGGHELLGEQPRVIREATLDLCVIFRIGDQ
jgi:hypothetical protein